MISIKFNRVQKILARIESYPMTEIIFHTIMVVASCVAIVMLSNTTLKWKDANIQLEIKQAEIQKEIQIKQAEFDKEIKIATINAKTEQARKKIEAEIKKTEAEVQKAEMVAREEEALAAQNPYALAAREREDQSIVLTIKGPGYNVGNIDSETEVSFQPVEVNGRKYNHQQRNLLTLAFHIGSEIGYPESIQSILLQETLAGAFGNRIGDTNLPTLKRSYGVMQVKASTARYVLKLNPDIRKKYFPQFNSAKLIRDEEIIILLIQDDVFNIKVGSLYFAHQRKTATSWAMAIVSYNAGMGRAKKIENLKEHDYYRKIVRRLIKEVRPFNESVGLFIPKE